MGIAKGWMAAAVVTACVSAAVLAADKSPVEARKELGAMGLSYSDSKQFLDAWKRNDRIAVDLFLAAQAIDLNALRRERMWDSAYKNGDRDMARRLLAAGYAPDTSDFLLVLGKKDAEMLRALTAAPEFKPQRLRNAVLAGAIETNDMDALRHLVGVLGEAARAKINAVELIAPPGSSGETGPRRLLNYAVAVGSAEAVQYLLELGADVNAVDPRLANVKAKDWFGNIGKNYEVRKVPETPIMTAARTGREDLIDLLIRAGADPNVVITQEKYWPQTYDKHTALSYARQAAQEAKDAKRKARLERTVEALLRNGAKEPPQSG